MAGAGRRSLGLVAALLLAACEGATPAAGEAPLAVDISGTWAGTWSGTSPQQGPVTGTWTATVAQTAAGVAGTLVLGGDVDCPDATIASTVASAQLVGGVIDRPPCAQNEWTMTSLDLVSRTTSGVWLQRMAGAVGTFTGAQVGRRGGPQVFFFAPLSGPSGTLVTIAGRGFSPSSATAVDFAGIPSQLEWVGLDTAVARVPAGAGSGRIAVTTPYGTAMSPRPFDPGAGAPRETRNAVFPVGARPEGVALGPDGRRVFVANRADGTVSMIDLRVNLTLATTAADVFSTAPVQGIAPSPDGRRIYVSAGEAGVVVLDTALDVVVDAISVAAGDGTHPNPQGIAISPDGRTLYVADDRDGGAVSVVDLATREVVASLGRGPGTAPKGVAASPDGKRAYLAFRGAEVVDVFDVEANATVAAIPVGALPIGLAVAPDGTRVWVSSLLAGTVTELDADALSTLAVVAVGNAPNGIALSPDGSRLHVANRGDGTVSVVSTATHAVVATIPVCTGPTGIAMSPDGTRALVTCSTDGTLVEIGGPYTLTVGKAGSGYGTVTSSPDGILCGPSCQARFDPDTVVTLTAVPDGWSYFDGWSEGCSQGTVTLAGNRSCTATFTSVQSGSGTGPDNGAHCFIATAAYGSPHAREVAVLRAFRDGHLLGNAPGRAFVRAYYALSPPLARAVARHPALAAATRGALSVVVAAVEHPRAALLVALALGVAGASLLRRRLARRGM